MLDWIFLLFVFLAVIMIMLAIHYRGIDTYWNILFIALSATLWFILALLNAGGIETAYAAFNTTTGVTTLEYDTYINEQLIYLSYFFMLMGALCMIYLVVTIFGYYYEKVDRESQRQEDELE